MTDVVDADGPANRQDAGRSSTDGAVSEAKRPGLLVSRRAALMGGALGLASVAGASELDPSVALATPTVPAATATVAMPTTTAPEQVRLAWGADPTTQVTVSWSAPGTAPMPAPTLAYATSPISSGNAGTIVTLPAVTPLSLASPRTGPSSTSFADQLSGQTTYHYHVPISGLKPDTKYYYEISDGATTPSTLSGSFTTAPTGRSAYRFTAFGDIGTPYTGNPSNNIWTESSDTSIYTIDGVINPGDGAGPGLFHLMLGDLSYANVNPGNTPNIWRDYQVNASRASQNQPWMPIMGNHEVEIGASDTQGTPTSGQYYNGPYGAGNYFARHLLPDNGVTNWDGNRLQGSFYSFQVGTVLFICLNTNDVAYQNPQTASKSTASYGGTYDSGVTVPTTLGISQYLATGKLTAAASNTQLVPDTASGTPHLQTQWLQSQLQAARAAGSSVDIIVVCEHHCALSSGPNNGCDMAIRAAWLPLYDEYEVDLVIGGHDHDYERSYPVRGYDSGTPGAATGAFSNPWGSYVNGQAINTRRPTVVTKTPTTLANGAQAWDTAGGTVFLQLGGAGAAAGPQPTIDSATGARQAVLWATDTGVSAKQCATEDALWSANYDTSDNYGYAVFDVDPGNGPGQTKLTYRWFQVPTVANGGTATMQTTPWEEFVFTRFMPAGAVAIHSSGSGPVQVGQALTAAPSGWPTSATYAYQWLRNGTAISGATAASYTTAAADAAQTLSVQVTVSAQSYPATSVTSASVSVGTGVTPAGPSAAVPTIVAPKKQVGAILTAQLAGVPDADVLTFQWLRGGTVIDGATKQSYLVRSTDVGKELAVQVTQTKAGFAPVSTVSKPVKITDEGFSKTPAPTIHGTPIVGHTVTAEVSGWSPAAEFKYQWLLNGAALKGATHKTLKLERAYAGRKLSVRVTGSHAGYVSHEATSAHVYVEQAVLKAIRPRISGKALVGETLHAHIGEWPSGTEFSYRWFVGGLEVAGATGHAFRLLPGYRGKRVSLEVTGALAGHHAARAVSAPTKVVRRAWTLL